MNALDNSTRKCDFLRMCYKCMFGILYCCIQSVGPLKVLYTSHPGIPFYSDTNSNYLDNIQLVANTTRRLFTHVFPCFHPRLIARFRIADEQRELSKVAWHGKLLAYSHKPVYLEVTLDRCLTHTNHIAKTKATTGPRNNILKKLANTNWGT